jgi:glucose-6-phosphate 1-dehydrogenase
MRREAETIAESERSIQMETDAKDQRRPAKAPSKEPMQAGQHLATYNAGGDGPPEADELLARDGRRWRPLS